MTTTVCELLVQIDIEDVEDKYINDSNHKLVAIRMINDVSMCILDIVNKKTQIPGVEIRGFSVMEQ